MPLSETAIRQAKSESKPIKMFDGRGLYLLVNPNGSRGWRFKYRIDGREKLISFGIYPDVPLKLARDRREAARQQLAAGIDPGAKRKAERVAQGDVDARDADLPRSRQAAHRQDHRTRPAHGAAQD